MGLFSVWNVSASALSARRLQMDVIANNVANATTTRTVEGGPYKRQSVVFRPVNETPNQRSYLFPDLLKAGVGQGVKAVRITEDTGPGKFVYDPNHPDAIQFGRRAGYVEMPNISPVQEMTDLISATRAYEAAATMIQNAKRMFGSALNIGSR